MDKSLNIDGEKIQLTEVAANGDKKLYRFESDWRITPASKKEINENFPEYEYNPLENLTYSFLIEYNGKIRFYDPDGEPIDDNEIECLD